MGRQWFSRWRPFAACCRHCRLCFTRHSFRVRQVPQRQGHGHRLHHLSRASAARARRDRHPRDLRTSDFIRQTTEQLAKEGFVAIVPDLLSRRGGTPSSPDSARKLIATLNPDTITQDLDATRAYLKTLKPVRSGEIG